MNRRSFLRAVLGIGTGVLAAPLAGAMGKLPEVSGQYDDVPESWEVPEGFVEDWNEYNGEWYRSFVRPNPWPRDYMDQFQKPYRAPAATFEGRIQQYLEDMEEVGRQCHEWLKDMNCA